MVFCYFQGFSVFLTSFCYFENVSDFLKVVLGHDASRSGCEHCEIVLGCFGSLMLQSVVFFGKNGSFRKRVKKNFSRLFGRMWSVGLVGCCGWVVL